MWLFWTYQALGPCQRLADASMRSRLPQPLPLFKYIYYGPACLLEV